MSMIPKVMTKLLGNGPSPDPGRGGSGAPGAGGPAGASGGLPEKFEQRGFLYGECQLAAVTGISIRALQKKRAKGLRQGVDWDLAGLRVAYSAEGLAAILAAVTGKELEDGELAGIRLSELQEKTKLPGDDTAAEGSPDVRTARVRRFFPNPYIIECELLPEPDGSGRTWEEIAGATGQPLELVVVRVKTAKNFRKGMAIPLRRDGRTGRYELARRLPRFPGKW